MRSRGIAPLALFLAMVEIAGRGVGAPISMPAFSFRVKAQGPPAADGVARSIRTTLASVSMTAKEGEWSDWAEVPTTVTEPLVKNYPNAYMGGWPFVMGLQFSPAPTPLEVDLETKVAGVVTTAHASLFGSTLGLVASPDAKGVIAVRTMADHNRKYWKALDAAGLTDNLRPRKIKLVDRFIGGDEDRLDWEEGIRNLARVGFNVIFLPPDKRYREILLNTGLRETGWAVYNPPGYAFDFDEKECSDEAIMKFAEAQAKPYRDAGYAPEDVAFFGLADEPGWYYPSMLKTLNENPEALVRFRDYLKKQKLTPPDLGAGTWEEVKAIGRSAVLGRHGEADLRKRRLYYWTCRFFPWASCSVYARTTRALEKAFYPSLPVTVNFNFFAGRYFFPGTFGNNPDKDTPDAAMGGHDWLEFGRQRGCTTLWTEDWFGDGQAYQWSFYASKLRSAARKSGIGFGGYIIGRTAGEREDGIVQKTLCLVGHGAKTVKYYVFGPEYNFPGNCYSENPKVYAGLGRVARLIAKAEDVLYPGEAAPAQVAILTPQSSQPWDQLEQPIASGIVDATNTNLNSGSSAYTAEAFDTYLALMHANIPADFVDEQDLLEGTLKNYRVLYMSGPNLPTECQRAVVKWVKSGGVLATCAETATRDRYDNPEATLSTASGIEMGEPARAVLPPINAMSEVTGTQGTFTAVVAKELVTLKGAAVVGVFGDGSPAVTQRKLGKGQVVHFATYPGISYWVSSKEQRDGLPAGFSESARRWITWPVELAKLTMPVYTSVPMVEAPVLSSKFGTALTLLNWSGANIGSLAVNVKVQGPVTSVESVQSGAIQFLHTGDRVRFTLPLNGVDVVKIR
ncbi:MAG: beta-galactosidase trimerization domain-containing protein [Armatimonadetes bacterium]|nr:beta-galactosidase trimerization domain-containing protein [Armatimonadota bacterium]